MFCSSSLGSFGYLLVGLFLLLSLFGFPLSLLVLLLLLCTFFSPYTLVFPFAVYASHFSSLILFWIVASIVYSLLSFGVVCNRIFPHNCALFLSVEALCSLCRVSWCFYKIVWDAWIRSTFHIKLVSLVSFVVECFLLQILYVSPGCLS